MYTDNIYSIESVELWNKNHHVTKKEPLNKFSRNIMKSRLKDVEGRDTMSQLRC